MRPRTRWILGVVSILWASLTLLAAMSDPKALSETKRLFGSMGGIATVRAQGDTYWTKQVGVYSPGCRNDFQVLGSGLNTWEAAFFAVPADTIKGPFSGDILLKNYAWDNVGVTGWQWLVDGKALGPELVYPAGQQGVQVQLLWQTATGPQGLHTICGFAKDEAGNIGRTRAWVVLLDQTKPSIGTVIDFQTTGGIPSIAGQ